MAELEISVNEAAGSLASLPEQQRRALVLREWQGLSYHEIAAELGLSHAAVETLLFRARRMLASELTTPQRSKRRGLLKTLNLGPFLSAVKSLFGAGGVKLAVVVAVAIAGSSAHVGRRPVDKQAAATPAAPSVRAPRMVGGAVHRPPARLRQHAHAATSSEGAPSSGRADSAPRLVLRDLLPRVRSARPQGWFCPRRAPIG